VTYVKIFESTLAKLTPEEKANLQASLDSYFEEGAQKGYDEGLQEGYAQGDYDL
jgi:flagellar biosynthesis/type III secretory pathway protein FliH